MEWVLDNIPRIIGSILFVGIVYLVISEMMSKKV